jgi:hypothetical protein
MRFRGAAEGKRNDKSQPEASCGPARPAGSHVAIGPPGPLIVGVVQHGNSESLATRASSDKLLDRRRVREKVKAASRLERCATMRADSSRIRD